WLYTLNSLDDTRGVIAAPAGTPCIYPHEVPHAPAAAQRFFQRRVRERSSQYCTIASAMSAHAGVAQLPYSLVVREARAPSRNGEIRAATSRACVSNAKCPVSSR